MSQAGTDCWLDALPSQPQQELGPFWATNGCLCSLQQRLQSADAATCSLGSWCDRQQASFSLAQRATSRWVVLCCCSCSSNSHYASAQRPCLEAAAVAWTCRTKQQLARLLGQSTTSWEKPLGPPGAPLLFGLASTAEYTRPTYHHADRVLCFVLFAGPVLTLKMRTHRTQPPAAAQKKAVKSPNSSAHPRASPGQPLQGKRTVSHQTSQSPAHLSLSALAAGHAWCQILRVSGAGMS